MELELPPDVPGGRSRPNGGPVPRLATAGGRLVAYGRRGVTIDLTTARTLWLYHHPRPGLAVLDRHGGPLVVCDAPYEAALVRAFARALGLSLWLGELVEGEAARRLAEAPRLRRRRLFPGAGARGRLNGAG